MGRLERSCDGVQAVAADLGVRAGQEVEQEVVVVVAVCDARASVNGCLA
eukprot:COSAG06_NODE_57342_length_280_cov_1.430939_1_plen_48_part_10